MLQRVNGNKKMAATQSKRDLEARLCNEINAFRQETHVWTGASASSGIGSVTSTTIQRYKANGTCVLKLLVELMHLFYAKIPFSRLLGATLPGATCNAIFAVCI